MLDILIQALALVAIIGLGQYIKYLRWVGPEHFTIFSKLVLNLTLPCAVAVSMNKATISVSLLGITVVCIAINTALQIVGWLIGRRHSPKEAAFGVVNVGSFNMGAFASPYIAGFAGPTALVYASLFDIGNAISAIGIGRAWALSLARPDIRTTFMLFIRRMLGSVIFVSFVLLLILGLLNIRIPAPMMALVSTIGAANTFLAMLMIGIGLDLNLDRTRLIRAARWLAARYAVCILSALAVWFLAPFDHEIRLVIVMVLFAPIASMGPALTDESGSDVQLSSFLNTVTILVAIVVLPSLMLLLHA